MKDEHGRSHSHLGNNINPIFKRCMDSHPIQETISLRIGVLGYWGDRVMGERSVVGLHVTGSLMSTSWQKREGNASMM